MRISDWSSDVCSSDLVRTDRGGERLAEFAEMMKADLVNDREAVDLGKWHARVVGCEFQRRDHQLERIESVIGVLGAVVELADPDDRSEEHTSELQSLMRISYAVFGLQNKNTPDK